MAHGEINCRAVSGEWGVARMRAICGFGEGEGEGGVEAHDFAGGSRISGPRMTSTPGNLLKGKTDSLTAKRALGDDFFGDAEFFEGFAHHDFGGDFGPGDAGGFGDEGDGAGGRRG